jgi:hypothetical protein
MASFQGEKRLELRTMAGGRGASGGQNTHPVLVRTSAGDYFYAEVVDPGTECRLRWRRAIEILEGLASEGLDSYLESPSTNGEGLPG